MRRPSATEIETSSRIFCVLRGFTTLRMVTGWLSLQVSRGRAASFNTAVEMCCVSSSPQSHLHCQTRRKFIGGIRLSISTRTRPRLSVMIPFCLPRFRRIAPSLKKRATKANRVYLRLQGDSTWYPRIMRFSTWLRAGTNSVSWWGTWKTRRVLLKEC
jgi:hypothetical protein